MEKSKMRSEGARAASGAAAKVHGARDIKPQTGEALSPGRQPSLRDRLAQYFRSGQNASDRELAAMFGASVGSISVYRCQLKKLGVGVASPSGAARPTAEAKRGAAKASKRSRAAAGEGRKPTAASALAAEQAAARAGGNPLSLAEIDQVLVQNIETELGLIVERHPELARAAANVQQTVRLLLKLHRA
jgi:hypothetical protein